MIIGNGDIASALKETLRAADDGYVFFASGVSNSKEDRATEYNREMKLLLEQDFSKHLVYFSTLSIYYSDTRYTRHKKDMDALVKRYFSHYTIIRLGNITWGTNPHTIINYFRKQIEEGKPFQVQDTYRYIINKEDFKHWIEMIPDWSSEMNLPGRRMKVAEILNEYCMQKIEIINGKNVRTKLIDLKYENP